MAHFFCFKCFQILKLFFGLYKRWKSAFDYGGIYLFFNHPYEPINFYSVGLLKIALIVMGPLYQLFSFG